MWFIFAFGTMLMWGIADLFYKAGADESDKYSHLKTSVAVGFVMGAHAILTLIFGNISFDFTNIIVYLPVSAMYILSMTVGYFGLRYIELSISSPIQNTSGAIVCILCLIFLNQTMDLLTTTGVIIVALGIFVLGVMEKKQQETPDNIDKKYTIGFAAFFMPVIYCILDALGTFFDAWYLDDYTATPLKTVTEETFEDVANISYELTFFIVAVILFVFIKFIKKQKFEFFKQKAKFGAAIFETGGQFLYVRAMSGNGVVAAPMIAAYSIVSVILSRIFLKEKLSKKQYAVVAFIIVGIILLGIADGE